MELGRGACSWVSGDSTMRLCIPARQTRLGKTDLMLTRIPAQNGVSLTSREGLMLAMRKPTTVTAMPRASCSRASSSGNRQPQHVRASSSPHSLGAPVPFFGPMSSGPVASPAGGPPCLRWPRGCRSLPMAAAWVGPCVCGAHWAPSGAGRAAPALVFGLRRLNKYGKHLEPTGRASKGHSEPAAQGGVEGGRQLPTRWDAAPGWAPGRVCPKPVGAGADASAPSIL